MTLIWRVAIGSVKGTTQQARDFLLASLIRTEGACVYRKSYLKVIYRGAAMKHGVGALSGPGCIGAGKRRSREVVAVGVVGGGGA
jgi:hypothetical protein